MTTAPADPEVRTLPQVQLYAVRFTASQDELGARFAEHLRAVWNHLDTYGIARLGPPVARYYQFLEEPIDVSIGLPVPVVLLSEAGMAPETLPGGEAAVAVHRGGYDSLHETYDRLFTWIARHGHRPTGPHWDRFVVGPADDPDRTRWRTEVVVPL